MSDANHLLKTEFQFGSTMVRILEGNILAPGIDVDGVASTDDNYLTMADGVARLLAERAGPFYVRAAQAQCPVKAGTVVVTKAYRLPEHGLDVKYVLHGAVIDYDTEDMPLEEVVGQVTANCLEKAEDLGLRSILFPAFATGAGGLAMDVCARQMCSAIKAYLAQERPIKAICIVLYLPEDTDGPVGSAGLSEREVRNRAYIKEANLALGVPYDPALDIHESRDFFGRAAELQKLEGVITGKVAGKRHVVVLGGPQIGKWSLLDQLFHRAQQPLRQAQGRLFDSPSTTLGKGLRPALSRSPEWSEGAAEVTPPGSTLSQGQHLVKVTFGRVHENTSASFIYRKFLCALGKGEDDEDIRKEINLAYADPDMNCDRFLKFLEDHSDRYPQVVFLIDNLPRLLNMEAKEAEVFKDVRAFWCDLDRLETRVRFVYTARDDDQYRQLLERLEQFTVSFKDGIEVIELTCVGERERQDWVNELYRRYLGRSATQPEQDFFEQEAGQHPYLISLAGHALIQRIKRDRLDNPDQRSEQYDLPTLTSFFRDARKVMEKPRRSFFALLMDSLDREHRFDLQNLARAVVLEEEKQLLIPGLQAGDPNAKLLWQQLQEEVDPRENLHDDRLDRLERLGYLRVFPPDADKSKTAQFMAKSFAAYVVESLGDLKRAEDQPTDVVISLLSQERQVIRTMFHGRGARVITAQKKLLPAIKKEFMRSFGRYISHRLHPNWHPDSDPGVFRDVEEVSNYILAQFTDVTIKRYLERALKGSTILFMIDDAYKDIPWELMLESVYAGEIPFRVGRSIVSQQEPHNIKPPVRGIRKVKALLIGDPTDDLDEARYEVRNLNARLCRDHRFDDPDVLIGSEQCQRIRLLNALASGKYGLVHYSGHTRFEEEQSAWQLKDGKITTDMLTNAVQMAPPAFIFSSSCESAAGAEAQPIQYEDQTFDLPGAFLQAGVEAYIGTLWGVDSLAARLFSEKFYDAFLSGEHNLGECLRRAKWARKQQEEREGLINWLAFILYGNPHTMPGDLFPALRRQENSSTD